MSNAIATPIAKYALNVAAEPSRLHPMLSIGAVIAEYLLYIHQARIELPALAAAARPAISVLTSGPSFLRSGYFLS